MNRPTVISYPGRDEMASAVASRIAERLSGLAASGRAASIAVCGGTTPGPMLTRLGETHLAWDRVLVTLTDERWVPNDSPRSNQRLLTETLFKGRAAAANFIPLYAADATPEEGAAMASAALVAALPLDIVVLGLGVDMHTASLFPGATGLDFALSEKAPPVVPIRVPGAEEVRVSLSAGVLHAARERHLMITGDDKLAALEQALACSDPRKAPILAVLEGTVVHYCA